MRYRSEIDGLRAIAVSLVLIFHFFPTFAPNGFIGVDLFFVISGYVITSQIYRQMRDDDFSFRAFFLRRIRRILPLVFTVVTATMIAGYFILLPSDFEQFTASAVAVSTFWSNIFFWRDGGYFGSADKLKPLLHMWSLSVEEQFYILLPPFLWLLFKLGRGGQLAILCGVGVMTALSFVLYAGLHAIGGATPAFFLTPSRIWQAEIVLKPLVDEAGEPVQLGALDRSRSLISGWDRKAHHLVHARTRNPKVARCRSLAHAAKPREADLQV
jgi:peptidoglycan/LPS O-acetylase OafA/YrhL